MGKRTLIGIVAALSCVALLSSVVLAMSSTNYRLDWFTPLTGGGGGAASSASYAVNLTVGQSVVGASASADYGGCLGYWCGVSVEYKVFLPLVLRDH
jgi:hypothetical protein